MAFYSVRIEVSPRPDVSRTFLISTQYSNLKDDCLREIMRFTDDDLSVVAAIERFRRDGDLAYCVCIDVVLVKIFRHVLGGASVFKWSESVKIFTLIAAVALFVSCYGAFSSGDYGRSIWFFLAALANTYFFIWWK